MSNEASQIITLEAVANSLTAMERRFSKFMATTNKALTSVTGLDPDRLTTLESRHKELSQRFAMFIEKITVVTEVGYYARHSTSLSVADRAELLSAVIWALDQPDEFWKIGTKNLSVVGWAARCLDAFQESKEKIGRSWTELKA